MNLLGPQSVKYAWRRKPLLMYHCSNPTDPAHPLMSLAHNLSLARKNRLLLVALFGLFLVGCDGHHNKQEIDQQSASSKLSATKSPECQNQTTNQFPNGELVETVIIQTSLGAVEIDLYPKKAPVTVGNFLAYVDGNHYDNASFYRVVGANPAPDDEQPILGVQGGLLEAFFKGGGDQGTVERNPPPMPPIAHESTQVTNIKNQYGVIGMARREPGTATSEFYVNLADNTGLDFGDQGRNPDGQGYAAFGKVSCGLDILQTIFNLPTNESKDAPVLAGELINNPVTITSVYRKSASKKSP